ncbi:MAG: LysR family transcriptional regulator [Parachlamydiales bacterium]|nr:LysR family transcriptional regulator [Parachlamydiales bacterium]
MDIFSLECFIAVSESGSFTKAAARVNRTQSAITQQIGALEKKLGVVLFDRGKKATLTKDGEIFLLYALRIYGLHREIVDRFKHPELNGEAKIGIPEDFASLFLADVLVDFSRIHPLVFLSVECDLTLNLLNRFKSGKLDLVVLKMNSPEEFPQGVEIWNEPLVWVRKKGVFPLTFKNRPIPLVLSPEPCVYRSKAIAALDGSSIRWRMVYTSPSYAGIIAAVKANMGITALPVTMIPDDLEKIDGSFLPPLPEIHVSLLKKPTESNTAIETLSQFLLKKLTRPS